jgi:asparagine synthase (glutamine-hydrolysing)
VSAIAGVLCADGRAADPALLARMAQALAHRGGGDGQWVSGSVGLAHRGRAVDDKQPVTDAVHDGALVLDGRLDDVDALRRALGAHRAAPDAELALAAWTARGGDPVDRLAGDFAVALWDGRTRTLACARDACGVKPLFYHWDGRRLLFASEIAALFADPGVARRPDAATIADFLLMDFRDPGATFFAGIRRVPAGHTLAVNERGATLRRWWTPRLADAPARSAETHHAAFAERFTRAVADRLRDAPSAGVLLSGGIDSTLVAAVAAAQRRASTAEEWLAGVTVMHEGFLAEDRDAIAALVAAGGIRAPRGVWDLPLLDMLLVSSEPPDHAGHPALGAVLDATAAAAFRVLLTGVGGDELSSAAERGALADALTGLRLRRAWADARALVRAYGADDDWRATLDGLWSALPAGARRVARRLGGRARPRWLRTRPAHASAELGRRTPRPELPTRAARAVWDAVTAPALTVALEKLDADGARLGIEPRHPYLDRRVVECMLAVPPDVLVGDGYRKQFVQRALAPVVARPPRGTEGREVHVPLADPLRARRQEAARLERGLFAGEARVFEYVERAEAEGMWQAWLRGDERHAPRLWDFLRLERWLREAFPA